MRIDNNYIKTVKDSNGSLLTSKKHRYTFLFAMTYFVSYLTRINFSAIIAEMVTATGYPKSALSIAITISFVTYGIGQCISGFLGDRFSPKRLITIGLCTTAFINALLPVLGSALWMILLWGINGFAQSFMWPPLVKIMIVVFSDEEYKYASVKVSWASSFGTVAIYLLAPILISLYSWKAVFWFSSFAGLLMLFIWHRYCPNVISPKKNMKTKQKSSKNWFCAIMIPFLIVIVFQGMLRDGVTTWIPSFIAETYQLQNSIAILTSVVLPLFAVVCFNITAWLYRTVFKNPLVCAGVLLLTGSISGLFLLLTIGKTPIISIGLSAIFTGTMHGVNLIVTNLILPWFKKYNKISTISGILNSCTYIGSAISTYATAVFSEKLGWNYTVALWSLIALSGTLVCFITARAWMLRYK